MRITLAAVLATTLLAGCGGGSDGTDPEQLTDPAGELACREFRSMQIEIDTLSEAEVVKAIEDIYRDHAWVSETRGIASSSRAMLVAVRQNDSRALTRAAAKLDRQCKKVGH